MTPRTQISARACREKSSDWRRSCKTEVTIRKRHLTHQKGENQRIQMQLGILKTEKTEFQNRLKVIKDRMDQIEREVGEG